MTVAEAGRQYQAALEARRAAYPLAPVIAVDDGEAADMDAEVVRARDALGAAWRDHVLVRMVAGWKP